MLKMSYLIIYYNENYGKLADINVDKELRHLTWSWSRQWQLKVKSNIFIQNNHKNSKLLPDTRRDIPDTVVDTQQHIGMLKQLNWLDAVDKHWLAVEQKQLVAIQQQQQLSNSISNNNNNSNSDNIASNTTAGATQQLQQEQEQQQEQQKHSDSNIDSAII
jgi:hypothetical protein